MKKITCKKPCTIGGKPFVIGDTVPAELIAPGREDTLVGFGLISVSEIPDPPAPSQSESNAETNRPDGESGETDGEKKPDGGESESTSDGEKKPEKKVRK